MNALTNIERIKIKDETLILLLELYESKGKIFYYDNLFSRDLDSFLTGVIHDEIFEISKFFKINVTPFRIKLAVRKDFSPKNKDEQLLLNIKNAVNVIEKNHENFEFITNEIHELALLIGKNITNISWNKSDVNNKSIREKLEELILLYNKLAKLKKYEAINLMINFYVDFINMNFFNKYNEIIGLLLLYTLIFKKFPIFKYISFFKQLCAQEEKWNYGVTQANYNWNSGFSQTTHLAKIIYQILKDSYKKVDEIAYQYEFERKLNKVDNLENTILKFKSIFSKEDLRKIHPTISTSTINRTLHRLRDQKKIISVGTGRSTKWILTQKK